MTEDLLVRESAVLSLGDNSPDDLAAARSQLEFAKLSDLVDHGILDSMSQLDELLRAAANTTAAALQDVAVYRARRFVPGLKNPDLGRFPRMLATVPQIHQLKVGIFWRMVRGVPAAEISEVGRDYVIARPFTISKWNFNDVTVEADASLELHHPNSMLQCAALLIRPHGRIVSHGLSLYISARSIKGE